MVDLHGSNTPSVRPLPESNGVLPVGRASVLVGAPRANTSQPDIVEGGAVYYCPWPAQDSARCRQIPFDTTSECCWSFCFGEWACGRCFPRTQGPHLLGSPSWVYVVFELLRSPEKSAGFQPEQKQTYKIKILYNKLGCEGGETPVSKTFSACEEPLMVWN